MIKSYAEKVIAYAAANGGICRQGFVKDLVDKAAQVAPLLKITCNNINNKVRNIKGPREHQVVKPAIPYHAIGYPTLFTNLDSSISSGLISERASAENLLDILANQATFILESSNQRAMSMQLTLPNQCSYKRCGAPLNLVPEYCSSCLRLVHQICPKFSVGTGVNTSTMLCLVCHDKQPPTTLPSITTAQASANVYDDSTALPINQPGIFPIKERVQTTQEVRDNTRAAYKRLQAAQATPFAADVEEEEDPLIPGAHPAETRNKGGRPIGSTIKHSRAQELA